jgi:hypothetical protein
LRQLREDNELFGYLARDVFNEYRSHVGTRSRRPKKRPKSLFASFQKPDGSEIVEEFLPKDQPYVLVMPIWNVPGVALGKAPTADFDVTQGHLHIFTSEDRQKRIAAENLKLGVWPYINYPTFARAIARISFSQAVAELGLDGFDYLGLPGLILGTYPNVPHYCHTASQPAATCKYHSGPVERVVDLLQKVHAVWVVSGSPGLVQIV